ANMASENTSNFTVPPVCSDPLTICRDEDFSQLKIYITVLYSLMFLVCFPGNIVTIFVYFVKMRPWKNSTIIMLNLSITDIFYVATLPFFIHYTANGYDWIFGDIMCKIVHLCFYFNMYSGIIFLSCFSIFRFVVIVYPTKCFFLQNRRLAVVTSAVIWMISGAIISPLAILIATRDTRNKTICPDLDSAKDLGTARWYNWLLTIFGFFLPLLTVTLCYVLIIYALATGFHTRAFYKQKARRLTIVLLLVFYVCFLPFHIFRGVQLELRIHPVSCHLKNIICFMLILSKPLAALNTFGNLLLYVVSGDSFQKAILSL
ncbi:OXGR1 protein, partial [Urocolius indicus]|nr:OXGR1 protein [Urocolius indicus]